MSKFWKSYRKDIFCLLFSLTWQKPAHGTQWISWRVGLVAIIQLKKCDRVGEICTILDGWANTGHLTSWSCHLVGWEGREGRRERDLPTKEDQELCMQWQNNTRLTDIATKWAQSANSLKKNVQIVYTLNFDQREKCLHT